MSRSSELRDLIRKGEHKMQVADALSRLKNNRDFQLLLNHISNEKVNVIVGGLSQMGLDTPEYKFAVRKLDSISLLTHILGEVELEGAASRDSVREARRYLGETTED